MKSIMSGIVRKLKDIVKNCEDKQAESLRIFILIIVMGIVMFFAEGFHAEKNEIFIWSIVVLFTVILLLLFDLFDLKFYQFAFLCIIIMGCFSLFLQPILNIPDEVAHFARAELVSRGKIFINPSQQRFETIQSLADLHEQIEKTIVESPLRGVKIDGSSYYVYHVAATNATFLYIPQAIGMMIAKVLNLNVIWIMWLGRLVNLFVYSFIVRYAIKLTCCLQFPLFFIAILPMSIQQAASLSPDALINALAILLIAFFLRLYSKTEGMISYKEIILFLILSILIIIAKVTNICIAGLFLLLPLQKMYKKRKAVILKIGAILVFAFVGAAYYYYTTTFAINLEAEKYLVENGVDSGKQIQYIFSEFLQWIHHFGGSALGQSEEYINMLNRFGWLSYGYAVLTPITVFMFAKVCLQEKRVIFSVLDNFLVFLMVIGTYAITVFALYVSWTTVGAAHIAGVQGRYFLPLLALLILPLCNAEYEKTIFKNKNDVTVMLGMVCSYLLITVAKYY